MKADALMRKAVFAVAGNRQISHFFRKYGMKLGVGRFVAAETLEDTVDIVRLLNLQKLMATLDFLGESVCERSLALAAAETVIRTLETIHQSGLNANVSVKLTQLGLNLDSVLCLQNMEAITAVAKQYNNFVRIDMEDSSVTDTTLEIYRSLLKQYGTEHIGIVMQAYLYRSLQDAAQLGQLGANVRFVKGAYKEAAELAYPDKQEVDANFVKLVQEHMQSGCYTAIATHDAAIIGKLQKYTEEQGIPVDRFEFQMLFGIAGSLQRELAKQGYRVRVYTPFGEHWYPYFTRRIAERPANLWFVIKGMLRK